MKPTHRMTSTVLAAAALLCVGLLASHGVRADTVDFTTLTPGTAPSPNPAVVYSLIGLPGPTGAPVSDGVGLSNSVDGVYPTANILDFAFTSAVSAVSFVFNNEGDNAGFIGDPTGTTYTAFDGSTVVATGNLAAVEGSMVSVGPEVITELQINNNCGASNCNSGDWIYDVDELTYTSAVTAPEPSSFLLLGVGLMGLIGMVGLRKRQVSA